MKVKKEIIQILFEEGPLKAKEISKKLSAKCEKDIPRSLVNSLLYGELNNFVKGTGFPKYLWTLAIENIKKDEDFKQVVLEKDKKSKKSYLNQNSNYVDSTQSFGFEESYSLYVENTTKYYEYFKMNHASRVKYFDEMLELKKIAEDSLNRIIDLLIKSEINIQDVYNSNNELLIQKVESNDRYLKWGNEKKILSSKPISQKESEKNQLVTNNCDIEMLVDNFRNHIKSNFFEFKTGNDQFDYLVNLIVKDNIITENEELFLLQKAKELNLNIEVLDKVKKAINSNNIYIDSLLKIIFSDGVITPEELKFLKEKKNEFSYSKGFINNRFWKVGITLYLNYLLNIKGFDKVLKLWYISNQIGFNLINEDLWLLSKLDIFTSDEIEIVIQKGVFQIEERLKKYASSQSISLDFPKIYGLIKFHNEKKKIQGSSEEKVCQKNELVNYFLRIMEEEKLRLGSPEANLLVENIRFRIANDRKWD